MKNVKKTIGMVLTILFSATSVFAHKGDPDVEIHSFENGETWTNCSVVLDRSLTWQELKGFASEGGNIISFRPLTGAKTLGSGKFDLGIAMSYTPIDQTSGTWNNTFAHPTSESNGGTPHWLGDQVKIPFIQARYGMSDRLDLGMYLTKGPGANYGFVGLDVQYNLFSNAEKNLYGSGRMSHSRMFGPEDLRFSQTCMDALFSKKTGVAEPYVGVSLGYGFAKETTDKLDLKPVGAFCPKAIAGIAIKAGWFSGAVECDVASVNTLTIKIGGIF